MVALWLGAAARVHAQAGTLPVALHWTRAPGAEACIGPTELAQRIETRLGRAVFEPAGTAEFALEGHIQPSAAGGFEVLLALNDAKGNQLGVRELSSPVTECRALDDAVTLVVTVTLYPESGFAGAGIALPDDVAALLGQALDKLERTPPPPPTPPPPRPPAKAMRDRERLPPPNPHDPSDSWRFALHGAGSGLLGTTPNLVFGAHIGLALVPPHWPGFEASAAFAGEDSTGIAADGSTGVVRVATSRYALGVCTRWDGQDVVETGGCLGVEALLTQARSNGLLIDKDPSLVSPAPFVSARVALWLGGGFALEASARAAVPLIRARLQYESRIGQERDVFQVSALYAEVTLGLTWLSGWD
jgi:hypothetical protein